MITKKTPLKDVLLLGQNCQRRNNCCKHGSGCLVGDDIRHIGDYLKISEKELIKDYLDEVERFNSKLFKPKTVKQGKPYGPCIFFDGNGCRIQEVKPLECRIGNCNEFGQRLSIWFMLNYQINPNDPESIRQYALYLKTQPTIPGGRLEELVPDKERLKKILDFTIFK